MKVNDILDSAREQAKDISSSILLLQDTRLSIDEKQGIRKNLSVDIKRLDALITLIDTDC